MRRALKIIFVVISVPLGLSLALLLFLNLPAGQRLIKNIAGQQLNILLEDSVSIGSLHTNVLSRLQLEQLVISQSGDCQSDFLLSLDSLSVEFSLFNLLRRKISLKQISLDGLQVNLSTDSTGQLNLPFKTKDSSKKKDAKKRGFEFSIGQLEVHNTDLRYQDKTIPIQGSLNGLTLQMLGDSSGAYRIEAQADSLLFAHADHPLKFTGLVLRTSLREQLLQVSELSLRSEDLIIDGQFTADLNNSPPDIGGNLHINGSPRQLTQIYGDVLGQQLSPARGDFTLVADISGNVSEPLINVRLTFPQIQSPSFDLRNGDIDCKITPKQVILNNFKVDFAGGNVSGNGAVLLDSLQLTDMLLNLKNISIARAAASFSDQALPINGLVSAQIRADGSLLSIDRIKSTASINISRIVYQDQAVPGISATLRTSNRKLNADITHAGSKAQIESDLKLNSKVKYKVNIQNLNTVTTLFNLPDTDGRLSASGSLDMTASPLKLNVDNLNISIFEGSIAGSAKMTLDSLLNHSINISAAGLDITRIWATVYGGSSPYQGIFLGSIVSNGALLKPDRLNLDAWFELQNPQLKDQPILPFTGSLSSRNRMTKLNISMEGMLIAADLSIYGDSLNGEYSVSIDNLKPLAELMNQDQLSGSAFVTGTLHGTLVNPAIEAEFQAYDIRYQGFPVDTLNGSLFYNQSQIMFARCFAHGNYTHDELNPVRLFPKELKTNFAYEGFLEGNLDSASGELGLHLSQSSYGKYAFDEGTVQLSLKEHLLRLNHLEILTEQQLFLASGEFDLIDSAGFCEIGFETDVTGETSADILMMLPDSSVVNEMSKCLRIDYNIKDLANISVKAACSDFEISRLLPFYTPDLQASGLLDFTAQVIGSATRPDIKLSLRITEPEIQDIKLDSLKLKMSLAEENLSIDAFEIFRQGTRSWLNCRLNNSAQGSGDFVLLNKYLYSLHSELNDIDLQLFNHFIHSDMKLKGEGNFKIDFIQKKTEPQVNGSLSLKQGEVRMFENASSIDSILCQITIDNTYLRIDTTSFYINNTPLYLNGEISLRNRESLFANLRLSLINNDLIIVKGKITRDAVSIISSVIDFDMSLLDPFLPGYSNLQGRLNSTAAMNGSFTDPDLTGILMIDEAGLSPDVLDIPFTDGKAVLKFSGNRIYLDSLIFKVNDGSVKLAGILTYKERKFSNVDLKLTLDGIKVKKAQEYQLSINHSVLTLVDSGDEYVVQGDVNFGENRITYPFRTQTLLEMIRNRDKPRKPPPAILKKVQLKIRIKDSRNIWIDNNIAKLRFHPDLALTGTLAQPIAIGRLTIEEGHVYYLDRKFEVTRGTLDFADARQINPYVDLEAQSTVKNYQTVDGRPYIVTLTVTGPANQTSIYLVSDPPLDKPSIMTLLTLGVTREQLSHQGSEVRGTSVSDVLRYRAGELSSRKISGFISRKVGNTLGLDEVTIEGDLFRIDNSTGPQFQASKKVTRRLGITYNTVVGHLNEQSVRVDYNLIRNVYLEGQVDQKGRSGLDMIYKIKF